MTGDPFQSSQITKGLKDMEEKTMETKAYVLRELRADDVFLMFRIISKVGVQEFKACFESDAIKAMIGKMKKGEDKKTAVDGNMFAVGMVVVFDICSLIVEKLPNCRDDIYAFLASLSGMTKDEIAALPMVTFTEMIVDVIKKEEFKDFFGVVSKLLK